MEQQNRPTREMKQYEFLCLRLIVSLQHDVRKNREVDQINIENKRRHYDKTIMQGY